MISFLQVENLSKRFGEQLLFENITFGIGKNQKVALIAKNGMGKSTLLRIIAGKDSADTGSVIFRNDISIGILDQDPELNGKLRVRRGVQLGEPDLEINQNIRASREGQRRIGSRRTHPANGRSRRMGLRHTSKTNPVGTQG